MVYTDYAPNDRFIHGAMYAVIPINGLKKNGFPWAYNIYEHPTFVGIIKKTRFYM